MSFQSGPLPRLENSQLYKTLPLPSLPSPSLTRLELENAKLKEEKKKLEAVVKLLCMQNLQYSEILKQHKAFDRQVKKEMGQTMRLMTGVLNMQLQNHYKMRTIEKQTIADWEEFCGEMKVEDADSIEEVLEDIKEQIIEKNLGETEEVIIGMEFMI